MENMQLLEALPVQQLSTMLMDSVNILLQDPINAINSHPLVQAGCTQGKLQCSKTGGISSDNAAEIIEGEQSWDALVNVGSAIVAISFASLWITFDLFFVTVYFGAFMSLGGYAMIVSLLTYGTLS